MPKFLGYLKRINFPFGTNGKLITLNIPTHNHIIIFDSNNSYFSDARFLTVKISLYHLEEFRDLLLFRP